MRRLALVSTLALSLTAIRGPLPRAANLPALAGGRTSTAVIAIHGGGWSGGTPKRVGAICKAVVAQLALPCFAPEYTMSTVAPYPAPNDDLVAEVERLRSLGYTRIGVVGESAGGTLAAWLATNRLVDVAVVWSAPSDLSVPTDTWGTNLGAHIRDYAPTRGARRSASPALRPIRVPLLVVNSAHELVPVSQARELYRHAEGPRHLTILDGSLHAAQYTALELPETIGWLDRYLRFAPRGT